MASSAVLVEEGYQRLVKARHGYVLYNRNDIVIGRLIELYGEYFEGEVDAFRHFVRPGDLVVDAGANIGVHTLALARLVGPRGSVVAFEPQRLVFQNLCANVALNSLDHVQCVNAAIGDRPGVLHLHDPDPRVENNFGGAELAMLAGDARAATVPQVVLDEFLGDRTPRLIKIDVEGMEAAVLRGARQVLARATPVLYVENDRIERSPALLLLLRELGYNAYWHLPTYVQPANYFANEARPFPVAFIDRGGEHLEAIGFAVNLLCVHQSHGQGLRGLPEVTGPDEHPYRRDCAARLSNGAIPVLRG